jgi:hypothetical protein
MNECRHQSTQWSKTSTSFTKMNMSISMQSQQSEPGASGPPAGTISRLKTSDVKFDQLFMGTPGCPAGSPLNIGDTFRICTPGGFLKHIKVGFYP